MAFGNTIYAYMLQQHAAQRAQAQQQAQLDQQASQFEAQRADGRRQELRQEVDQADAQKDQDFQRKFKIAQEYGRQAAARDENIPGFDNPALSEASELAFGAYPIEQKQAQDEREFKEKQWLLSLTGRQYAADKSNEGRHYAADARSGDVDKTLENKVDYRDLVLIPRNEEAVRNHDLQHQDRVATNGVRLSIAQTRAAATGKTPEMRKQGEFNA
jgi:GAF domain-containing protein